MSSVIFFLFIIQSAFLALNTSAKFHHLILKNEIRKNVLLSKFGFNTNGTLEFAIYNFTVPTAVIKTSSKADKFGIIGFSLSRGQEIYESTRVTPHICQLNQQDQDFDALFFVFDFETTSLSVYRSGQIKNIRLCPDLKTCLTDPNKLSAATPAPEPGMLDKILFGAKKKHLGIPYVDFITLNETNNAYSFKFVIHFNETQRGFYHLYMHDCFNYHEHGFSDKVAVDFTIEITEMNQNSHLSAGDIPKPQLYIFVSFLFALLSVLWMNILCKSNQKNVYFVHKLMMFLLILKILSTFCHGMNFYFLALYGQEREIWLYLFFSTHLLKGLLLFGTLILIETGYTFFKNFLTSRDRHLLMIILPLQVMDNIALLVLEESEISSQQYVFYFELFTVLDLLCCTFVLLPIAWSIWHLRQSAMANGKEFNLQKIKLFRQFYMVVIFYMYTTRLQTFFFSFLLPYNLKWVSEAMIEGTTLFFFVYVGIKFKPAKANIYLKLSQSDSDLEQGEALTLNGLYETVTKRTGIQDEIEELIPGTIANIVDDSANHDSDFLLPKVSR